MKTFLTALLALLLMVSAAVRVSAQQLPPVVKVEVQEDAIEAYKRREAEKKQLEALERLAKAIEKANQPAPRELTAEEKAARAEYLATTWSGTHERACRSALTAAQESYQTRITNAVNSMTTPEGLEEATAIVRQEDMTKIRGRANDVMAKMGILRELGPAKYKGDSILPTYESAMKAYQADLDALHREALSTESRQYNLAEIRRRLRGVVERSLLAQGDLELQRATRQKFVAEQSLKLQVPMAIVERELAKVEAEAKAAKDEQASRDALAQLQRDLPDANFQEIHASCVKKATEEGFDKLGQAALQARIRTLFGEEVDKLYRKKDSQDALAQLQQQLPDVDFRALHKAAIERATAEGLTPGTQAHDSRARQIFAEAVDAEAAKVQKPKK